MLISTRRSASTSPTSLLTLSLVALAGSFVSAHAQTAPQLLPYTVKLIAGSGTAAIAAGATCPVSGFVSTSAFGDGCLATEIEIGTSAPGGSTPGSRYAVADSAGNVFFDDFVNGLVRRVDVNTGIVSTVAGGASASPASGAACGAYTSTDARGDGCLGTAVTLGKPVGLAFSPAGDLYFGDIGSSEVRKIAATAGLIPSTGGIISLIAGNLSTYGYAANNPSGNVIAATGSYLDNPYSVAFDAAGNLYIAEEYKEALLVVDTNASTTTTVTGVSIPPGTIGKILGEASTSPYICPNSPASTNGCNYGLSTFGVQATSSLVDGPYGVAFDPSGNVYFADEYYNFIGKISSAGVLTQYAGIQSSAAKKLQRAAAGSFGIGSTFGIAADNSGNVYFTDASNGVIWRVDGAGQSQYVVAGGASTVCATASDTFGDGCPATQAKLGSSGTGNYAATAAPGPGVFGVTVDAYSDLFFGDTETNLIREVASGTQFGNVGENQATTQTLEIHFASSDVAASGAPFTITSGPFTVGAPTCTLNSDATTDCLLPVTATATALGAFAGSLQVKSSLGGVANFPLSGVGVMSPFTRISVAATSSSTCTGSSIYSTSTPVTLTATIVSSGSPSGTVTFYANGTAIGTAQAVAKSVASLTTTFPTANTYLITATYSGDTYYHTSTTASSVTVVTSAPTFIATAVIIQPTTIAPGQTGLYSFAVAQNVYAGTISMACSGLPANASCVFSPNTLVATGCSTSSTVALSIVTAIGPVSTAGLAAGGTGVWSVLSLVSGVGLALLIGLRRRSLSVPFGRLGMAIALLLATSGMLACGAGTTGGPATPAGSYKIVVTATGSTGTTSTFTVPLVVN